MSARFSGRLLSARAFMLGIAGAAPLYPARFSRANGRRLGLLVSLLIRRVIFRNTESLKGGNTMSITLRQAQPEDAAVCGRICYEAFKSIAAQHNFPPEFPSLEIAVGLLTMMLATPKIYAAVAEQDGRIVGSNFVDERTAIAGIGPITVDPAAQNAAVGRRLMEHILERAEHLRFPGVRLVQAAYHNRSLCLYTKLGFETREPLSTLQGPPLATQTPGYTVRAAAETDLAACNALCFRVHGHHRGGELHDAITRGSATVVERAGRLTGYATAVAFFGHAVGETNGDIKALIAAAPVFLGPGFIVPTRNGELMRWCLANGLRLVHQLTLMTVGLYNEPRGAYLPSIAF
jgi:predicted N-acetyltransferase YhbS